MIFSALRPVILRDSDSFRQNIFSELKLRSPLVRFTESFYLHSPPALRAWLLLGYGLKSYLDAPSLTKNVSCVYSYENERQRFEYLKIAFAPRILDQCGTSNGQSTSEKILNIFNSFKDLPRLLRLLRFISTRYDFLVSCRVSSTIFYYFWFHSEIKRKKPEAVFLSSEANPYAMALLWAARKYSIPSIYVPHGQISPNPPRHYFDLSLLDGEELKSTFEKNDPIRGQVIMKGTDGEFHPLCLDEVDSPGKVGIFLSVIYDPDQLAKAINEIHERFPDARILIRLHPNESVSSSEVLRRVKSLPIEVSRGRNLADDIRECGIIFCGNSGTHLEALRQGVPTVQVPGLDLFPHDTRKFLVNRVVPWFDNPASVTGTSLREFYDSQWEIRMRKYDFFYGLTALEKDRILKHEISEWFKARSETQDNARTRPDKRI